MSAPSSAVSTPCRTSRPRSSTSSRAPELAALEPLAPHVRPAALDRAGTQGGDDLVGGGLGHLDKRKAVGDLDRPDLAATDARLVGDRPDEILRADPGSTAGAHEQTRHA